jgi:hypothetical protein
MPCPDGLPGLTYRARALGCEWTSTARENAWPRAFVTEGDKVVVMGEASWLVKSTGRSDDSPWVDVFALREGKIARTDTCYDTAPAARAFSAAQPGQAPAADLRH